MSKLFPFSSVPDLGDREPKLVDLDEEAADEVFDALGSETARSILLELHEEPRPASQIAEAVDTSVQNVQYHLTKLSAADLVTVVDTWYSESGTEMDVYAPADEALVLFAGEDAEGSLRRLLTRLAGALAVLAVGAAVVALAVRRPTARSRSTEAVAEGGANMSATAAQSGGADPLVAAATFVGGGLLVLAGLFLVDRLLG